MTDRAKLFAGAGVCLLVSGLAVLFVATPVYTTDIERSAAGEQTLATASDSLADTDVIPFATLSAAERRAVAGAIDAPDHRYTDRGAPENGTTFEYQSDVARQYVVG